MTPIRPCPICRAPTAEHLHVMHFALPPESPLPTAYAIVACDTCGFVYADTPGSAADYALHYTKFSLYEKPDATGGESTPEDQERFKVIIELIGAHCKTDARILDIGCGNGGLLFALREAGFTRLVGMDPSPGCIARLRAGGIDGVSATLGKLPGDIGHYDLVILSHVLEHLLEPFSAMQAVQTLLTDKGLLYIETPDAEHYSAHDFIPYYFFDSEHINHFERHSFHNLSHLSGYTPVEIASKNIPVKGGRRYPAVHALLRKQPEEESSLQYDAYGRQRMLAYIQASAARANEFAHMTANIAVDRPLALWGAGSFAQRFLEQPWLADRRIVAVVDNDPKKDGQHLAGCTIRKPAEGLQGLPANTLLLILIALHPQEAVQQYQQLGLPYEHLVLAA